MGYYIHMSGTLIITDPVGAANALVELEHMHTTKARALGLPITPGRGDLAAVDGVTDAIDKAWHQAVSRAGAGPQQGRGLLIAVLHDIWLGDWVGSIDACLADNKDGSVTVSVDDSCKSRYEDVELEAIAPFVKTYVLGDHGIIYCEGEMGEHFRYVFHNGELVTQEQPEAPWPDLPGTVTWHIQPWNDTNTAPTAVQAAEQFGTADEAEAHGRATYPHGVVFSDDNETTDQTERVW